MSTGKTKGNALVRELFAPWDEYAWERLCDKYPDIAARVEAAVAGGVEPDDVLHYAEAGLYSSRVAAWLAQAVAHAQRTAAPDVEEEPPETAVG